MARKRTPPVEPDAFGQALEESIKTTEALLAGLRYELGQKVLEVEQGGGEMPTPFEVAAVKKLEIQLEADKMYLQARAMTRRRSEA